MTNFKAYRAARKTYEVNKGESTVPVIIGQRKKRCAFGFLKSVQNLCKKRVLQKSSDQNPEISGDKKISRKF